MEFKRDGCIIEVRLTEEESQKIDLRKQAALEGIFRGFMASILTPIESVMSDEQIDDFTGALISALPEQFRKKLIDETNDLKEKYELF